MNRLEDDLIKKTRPKFGSKRWRRLYAIVDQRGVKCEICGAMLFNPQSILIHQGNVCQKQQNGK